jgi:anti-sigma regulatory factor (Ser/Thr protein kinase)
VWQAEDAFCHQALFYEGEAGFLDVTLPFIRDAVARREPILVLVSGQKIDSLRAGLFGMGNACGVQFADVAGVGRNPATIIPVWRDFVNRHASGGRRVRGISEPIWPGRTPQELLECHLHESLLNLAFSGPPAWWLVCPYDTAALDPSVIEEAERTHPVVGTNGLRRRSLRYEGIPTARLDVPLPEPAGAVSTVSFGDSSLSALRAFVAKAAETAGIDAGRAAELVVAVNEVATNSIRHGGGMGTLRVWKERRALVCEVRDRGQIQNLLAGRTLPGEPQTGGYGLWLVNHICDLVQVRSSDGEGVVRLHMDVA